MIWMSQISEKFSIIIIIIIIISPGFSRIKVNILKYVVDRGILRKLEVAVGQQNSAQACLKA
jgi:hypothetical protein